MKSSALILLILTLLCSVGRCETPVEAELLKASRSRYPGSRAANAPWWPGGMGWYNVVSSGHKYFAFTTDGTVNFENNRYKTAVWEYVGGNWSPITLREGMTYTSDAWHKMGFSGAMAERLSRSEDLRPFHPGFGSSYSPPSELARELMHACARNFGSREAYMDHVFVQPYKDSAFGVTAGTPAGVYVPLIAIWERKGGRWSWIFDYEYWPRGGRPRRSADLDHLFAQYGFSPEMAKKLRSGIWQKLIP